MGKYSNKIKKFEQIQARKAWEPRNFALIMGDKVSYEGQDFTLEAFRAIYPDSPDSIHIIIDDLVSLEAPGKRHYEQTEERN